MNLNKLSDTVITGVKKVSQKFNSCPIKLRKTIQDTFEKSQDFCMQEYLKAYKANPNTAFLQHPNYSHAKKLELLRNSDTVHTATQLKTLTGIPTGSWLKDECFNVEWHKIRYDAEDLRAPAKRILDLSDPLNAKNMEFIKKAGKEALDPEVFRLKTGMDIETYQRYIKEGFLQRLQLEDKTTGEMVDLGLIGLNTEINKAGLARFKRIHPQSGRIHQEILKNRSALITGRKAPVMARTQELKALGFGSQVNLIGLVKTGKVDGVIKKGVNSKGQKIMWAEIDLNNVKTMGILQQLRRQTCISLDAFSQKTGINVRRIEDAILSGEIAPIREKVFATDTNAVLFDMTNPKNIEGFDKLHFEKLAQDELTHRMAKDRSAQRSLQYKLAWKLAPNTQMSARQAFAQSKGLKTIQDEIEKIKELISNPELKPEEVEAFEDQLIKLYKQEDIELKKIFGAMWHDAGTSEFKEAIAKAKEILEQVKTSGIDSITNIEIREFVRAHQG